MAKHDKSVCRVERELRQFVERAAAQEDRSLPGQIRHWVAEAPSCADETRRPLGGLRKALHRFRQHPTKCCKNETEKPEDYRINDSLTTRAAEWGSQISGGSDV